MHLSLFSRCIKQFTESFFFAFWCIKVFHFFLQQKLHSLWCWKNTFRCIFRAFFIKTFNMCFFNSPQGPSRNALKSSFKSLKIYFLRIRLGHVRSLHCSTIHIGTRQVYNMFQNMCNRFIILRVVGGCKVPLMQGCEDRQTDRETGLAAPLGPLETHFVKWKNVQKCFLTFYFKCLNAIKLCVKHFYEKLYEKFKVQRLTAFQINQSMTHHNYQAYSFGDLAYEYYWNR